MDKVRPLHLFTLISALAVFSASAQTTATWIGPASGGEWNTPANWDTGAPPLDGTTNAFIGGGTNVNYDLPMPVDGFGALTLNGVLNVNTNGFTNTGVTIVAPAPGGRLFINGGGAVAVNGNMSASSNAAVVISSGGTLTVSGTFTLPSGGNTAGTVAFATNNGGVFSAAAVRMKTGNHGQPPPSLFVINGGSNSLGNFSMLRMTTGPGALGADGLVIYNGLVNFASIGLGADGGTVANSSLTMYMAGGTATNSGAMTIRQATSGRVSRFVQTGGSFVMPDPGTVTFSPTLAGAICLYSVSGGTNIVGGFVGSGAGVAQLSNSAAIYVGSQGISVSGPTPTISLDNGGMFGATAYWTGSAPMSLSGGSYIFQAGDADGTPHNISISGVLSGSGNLVKTGGGTLTLDAAHTYSGITHIKNSTLALGASGSLTSPLIVVGSGATLDVSALGGAYTPTASQTLSGFGSVNGLVTATGGTIQPGSNNITGTLTFASGLTENGVTNTFVLSGNPAGNNDKIVVTGDLTMSGVNEINVVATGGLPAGADYTLIQYSGNFNGSIANFNLPAAISANAYLTNIVASNSIVLHVTNNVPPPHPALLVWVGNPVNNFWNTATTTNWLNNGSLDSFLTGDTNLFDATGAANPNVSIVGSVMPAAVTVDAAANYSFSGTGSIDGATGLTKSGAGTLTLASSNSFTGSIAINGGTVQASDNTNLGSSSGTIVLNGGALSAAQSFTLARGLAVGTNSGAGAGILDVAAAQTLDVSSAITNNGAGSGTLWKTGPGTLHLTNVNTYTGGTVVSNGSLVLGVGGGAGTIRGTLTIMSGGTVDCTAVDALGYSGGQCVTLVNIAGGTINNATGGNQGFDTDYNLTGGTMTSSGGGKFQFNDQTIATLASPTLSLISAPLQGRGGILTFSIASGTTPGGIDLDVSGVISDGYPVLKLGSGAMALSGINTYSGATTVSNGTLLVNGSLNAASEVTVAGGVLGGAGVINGSVDLQGSTVLSPGSLSVGTLTVGGNLSIAGDLIFELNKALSPSSDTVAVTGTLSCTGTGTLTLTNLGSALQAGDTFTLFSQPLPNGNLLALSPAIPGPGLTWTNNLAVDGTVSVMGTNAPPAPAHITNSVSGNILSLSWPAGQGWGLQTQTNSRAIGLATNWADVPGSTAISSTNITIAPGAPATFFRLKF